MKIACTALLSLCLALFLITCKEKPVESNPVETKIIGRISDKTSNNPIAGAIISTSPATSSVTTDGSGNYTVNNAKSGQYIVTASKGGYKPNSTTVSIEEGNTSTADVQLEQLTPVLAVSATTLDFGITQTSLTFTISNSTQYGQLHWSIVENADWLSVGQTSGTVTSGTITITLTANRVALAYGNYNTNLSVTSNGGNKDISITLTVQNPNAPQLTITPLILEFGETTTSNTFSIYNTGTGKLIWTATPQQSWITVSPTSDSTKIETDVVIVQVNRNGLPAGNYAGQVEITSNDGNQTISIEMTVLQPPTLAISTTSLDFGSTLSNLTFNVSNSGSSTLNWSITSDRTWLSVNPFNGTNNATVNVYVSHTGLNAGNYRGTLSVSSTDGDASVSVTMTVPTPSNPTAVTLNALTNITTSSVDLSWTQNNDSDFKQYEVHKSTSAGFTPSTSTLVQTITSKSTTSATVSDLTQDTTYYFKIRVVNTGDLFSDSNERSATINSATTGPYISDANTVALYHFDETSGNTAADASGNGNNGTVYGTTIVDGKYGKARQLNGISDWVQVPNSSSLQITNSITVEAWIYLTSQDIDWNSFVSKMAEGYGTVHGYDLRMIAESPIFTLIIPAGTFKNHEAGNNPIPINQWTHLAGTYDGIKVRIYMNGIKIYEASQSGSIAVGNEDLFIGKQNVTSNNRFTGAIIDEVRISNIARNPSEFHLSKHK